VSYIVVIALLTYGMVIVEANFDACVGLGVGFNF